MFGNLWWIFGILVLGIDFVNPFVGFFGMGFCMLFMFILWCFIVVMKGHRKKLGTANHLKAGTYIATALCWFMGIVIRPGIFSLASGLLTGIRKPAGIVFLWPESMEFAISLMLTILAMIMHTVMCLSIVSRTKRI